MIHVVFATKNRLAFINEGEMEKQLYAYISRIVNKQFGLMRRINGMPDHIHMLIEIRCNTVIADMIKTIKCNSSHWINENFSSVLLSRFTWQRGYGVFSVGRSTLNVIAKYIDRQKFIIKIFRLIGNLGRFWGNIICGEWGWNFFGSRGQTQRSAPTANMSYLLLIIFGGR